MESFRRPCEAIRHALNHRRIVTPANVKNTARLMAERLFGLSAHRRLGGGIVKATQKQHVLPLARGSYHRNAWNLAA